MIEFTVPDKKKEAPSSEPFKASNINLNEINDLIRKLGRVQDKGPRRKYESSPGCLDLETQHWFHGVEIQD